MDQFLNKVSLEVGTHNNKNIIWIRFPYNIVLINIAKSFNAKWSVSQKSWYVPDNNHFRMLLALDQAYLGKDAWSQIHSNNKEAFLKMKELLILKAYSKNTIKTYLVEFAQLLYLLKEKQVQSLTLDQLKAYCYYCIDKLGVSENQMHSRINAMKFYFEKVAKWEAIDLDIPRPKKPSKLPKVFNKNEVKRLFDVTSNPKHLLMLQLCYGMGLRVSEIVQLKITDIDSKRMQVLVEKGKGKKDRYVPLPHSIMDALRNYYLQYKPAHFLFEGKYGGQYAIRSVQQVFKKSMQLASINKPIGIHGLRHSYATHLLEYGTDISFIQKLLGHKDIKTTLIYTHVSNQSLTQIKSPLDSLNKNSSD